jgi:hypothetical protein
MRLGVSVQLAACGCLLFCILVLKWSIFAHREVTPPALTQVSDLTGSYRLYRKECLDQLMALCTSKVK